jgi:hypothetical protein
MPGFNLQVQIKRFKSQVITKFIFKINLNHSSFQNYIYNLFTLKRQQTQTKSYDIKFIKMPFLWYTSKILN